MAEVLITMGVIGVVAAMTLPTVINNSRNKQLEAGLKRSYSVIAQALDQYQAETGERIIPENQKMHTLKPILMKYIQTAQDCDWGYAGSGAAADITNKACIRNYSNASEDDTTYKNYAGTNNILLTYFDDGQFVMNDGSLVLMSTDTIKILIASGKTYLCFKSIKKVRFCPWELRVRPITAKHRITVL